MKTPILISLFAAAVGASAFADDYSVFRVCQDQRIIRTSDGAEAGHVEYIVVDPASRQVVSTVVSGGVIGDRFVAVPYEDLRFTGGREITLNQITRERLVSAPVIERTQISAAVIAPDVIQRTTNHFSMRTDVHGGRDVTGRAEDAKARGEAAGRNDTTTQNRPPGTRPQEGNADKPAARANERGANDPNARAGANDRNAERNAPAAKSESNSSRQQRNESAPPAGKSQREQSQNSRANSPNAEGNPSATEQQHEKAARDSSERSKAAAAKRDSENDNAQSPEEKRGAQGATERKPAEETPRAKKQVDEKGNNPSETAAKHSSKAKASEAAGDEKKKEDSSPR